MKLFKKIFAPVLMSVLLCLSFIMPSFIGINKPIQDRKIDVDELSTLSYEEKVDKLSSQFTNVETSMDGANYYFSGDIDFNQFDYLSTGYEDDDLTKNIKAKISTVEDIIEISNDVVSDGKLIFEENLKFSTEYDEETEQLFVVDENNQKIDILAELKDDSIQECFFLSAAISLIAALTVKQIVTVVVVATVATVALAAVTSEVINNSDVINRDLDRLLSGARDGVVSFWDRIKLACGKITAVALSTTISLTAELSQKLYEETKDRKDCYLLCGTITGNGFIPVQYKLTNYENARNWIKKGGSVWSPFSSTAQKCITGAGFIPGIENNGIGQIYITERHRITFKVNGVMIDFGFYHYHALIKGSLKKYGAVHSFFGQPFSGKPIG